jgi:hypothetical protein
MEVPLPVDVWRLIFLELPLYSFPVLSCVCKMFYQAVNHEAYFIHQSRQFPFRVARPGKAGLMAFFETLPVEGAYIVKRGNSVKTYMKRWFTLRCGYVLYFKQKPKEPLSFMQMTQICLAARYMTGPAEQCELPHKKNAFRFPVEGKGKFQELLCFADSAESRDDFIRKSEEMVTLS